MKKLDYCELEAELEYDRYILFTSEIYYPSGGFYDVTATSNNLEELIDFYNKEKLDRDDTEGHIFDCESRKVVKAWEREEE